MDFLPGASKKETKTLSSIAQAKEHTLSVYKAGRYVPIVFDKIDYIDCDKVVSHKVIISDSDELAYDYPVDHCVYLTDKYVTAEREEAELKALPCWAGEGWYREYVDNDVIVNFDNQAFGERSCEPVDIGLHYVEATDTLE